QGAEFALVFEEVDELLSDGQDLRMQSTLAENLATLYMREDNYRLAFNYQREFSNLKDSMLDEKIATAVAELNTQYETEKKESQLRQVTLENDLAQTKLSNRNIIIGALVGGLLILGLLFFQLLRQRNQISQQKEVIESALSEKEVLLREIHHRVKNNLQVVSSLLSLQSNYIEDETALEALREGRDRVKSMALIHQNLYQEGNLTGIQVEEYFDKLIRSLFNSYNIDPDRIQLETEIATLNLDVETVIPLGLIVNELVSNALKHAFPDEREGLIKIRLLEEQGELLLEVKDNGIGLSGELPTEEINSFGYRLVNAFKEKMSAKLSMDGSDGTTVQLRIKEYVLAA
ncbi:MAG: sensor histidine kinase, partial [Bacteroidota bacterium]